MEAIAVFAYRAVPRNGRLSSATPTAGWSSSAPLLQAVHAALCRREDGRDKFFIGNVRSAYKSARIRPRTARYGPRTHYVRSKLLYFAYYCHALVELLASYRERLFMNRRLRPWNDSPSWFNTKLDLTTRTTRSSATAEKQRVSCPHGGGALGHPAHAQSAPSGYT